VPVNSGSPSIGMANRFLHFCWNLYPLDAQRLPAEGGGADTTHSSAIPVGHSSSDTGLSADHVPTAETTYFDPEIVKDDPSLFDFTYTPPSNSTVRRFDPTNQLCDQLAVLSSDIINNLTTVSKK